MRDTAELLSWLVEHETILHSAAAYLMIAVGCVVLTVEVGFNARAPYGKHASLTAAQWYGPTIHPKAAWMFQESWAFLVPSALLLSGISSTRCTTAPGNRLMLAMFMGHYFYRSFVYPLRMRGGARMPIGICLLAAAFCFFNGYVQGRAWTAIDVVPAASLFTVAGSLLWAAGLGINLHSDAVLRNLRQPGETGYRIPRGGMFEFVSGANYFGEILEWTGYAIASGLRLPAVAFAFFTFANTAPRARQHHEWYMTKFDDYPSSRRAIIPFVW